MWRIRQKSYIAILLLMMAVGNFLMAQQMTGFDSTGAVPGSIHLNGSWKFKAEGSTNGFDLGWHTAEYDDSTWEERTVPEPWEENVDGAGWYRRRVELPEPLLASEHLKLVFHQVDDVADVYLNGVHAIRNTSWNSPFFVSIAGRATASGELLIAVRVEDHGGPGGILQPVVIKSVQDYKDLYLSNLYLRRSPSTLKQTGNFILYSVYVRNFSEEGSFKALRAQLPELRELGVNMLWLLPIHEIGLEKRKGEDGSPYAIRDYYSVHLDLGTKKDFRELVEAAHGLGMKVIIDSVMNHMSPDSIWAKEHPEWFVRDAEGRPRPEHAEWWDVVDLDWDNPEMQAEAAKMLEYWVREFDIDGYRCDVADLMPRPWWKSSIERLRRIKPGLVMLAESDDPTHYLNGFDMVYGSSLYDVLVDVTNGKSPASAIALNCLARQYGTPKDSAQMLFIENHDKQRAINIMGGPERAKAAAVLIATLPGVPLLYTGTEVGATADRDATFFKRTPVDFSSDPHGMRQFWSELLATRQASPALQRGEMELVDTQAPAKVFAFTRKEGAHKAFVAINFSDEEQRIGAVHELLPQEGIVLPPWQWVIRTAP